MMNLNQQQYKMNVVKSDKFLKCITALVLIMCFCSPVYAALQTVGSITFSRGVVAAQQPNQPARLLGKGADIYVADNIQTSEKSFAILTFNDGGKITVRPNSSFSITEYVNQQNDKKATFYLHKGGIRASTGEIAQKSPDNYKVKTELTTIGAQQASYSVRLCQNDCAQESEEIKTKQQEMPTDNVIARVVELKGEVTAQVNTEKNSRQLSIGGPLYANDHLESKQDSYALLVFRDMGRITLQANSQFDIKHYQYKQESGHDQAIYSLITGGLRVLTGKIGKANKQNFQVNTPVATIGIRGTGFDLLCQGEGCTGKDLVQSCAEDKTCDQKKNPVNDQMPGLHSYVWDSEITQTNKAGQFELIAPQANYIANQKFKPQIYLELPKIFQSNSAPRPDSVNVEGMNLFGTSSVQGTPSGVYVTVHDGHVQVQESNHDISLDDMSAGQQSKKNSALKTIDIADKKVLINLGRSEVAYINELGELIRLDQMQAFQMNDPYPLPTEDMSEQLELGIYSLLADEYKLDTSNSIFSCQCGT